MPPGIVGREAQLLEVERFLDASAAGFAVLALEGDAGDAFAALPDPQRDALEVALLRRRPAGKGPDSRAVAAAFLTLIRALAADGQVILAVDDWQWLDPPSRRVFEFAARRLEDEPVGLVCSVRSPSPGWPADDRVTPVAVGARPDRRGQRRQPVLRPRDRPAHGGAGAGASGGCAAPPGAGRPPQTYGGRTL